MDWSRRRYRGLSHSFKRWCATSKRLCDTAFWLHNEWRDGRRYACHLHRRQQSGRDASGSVHLDGRRYSRMRSHCRGRRSHSWMRLTETPTKKFRKLSTARAAGSGRWRCSRMIWAIVTQARAAAHSGGRRCRRQYRCRKPLESKLHRHRQRHPAGCATSRRSARRVRSAAGRQSEQHSACAGGFGANRERRRHEMKEGPARSETRRR